MPTDKNFVHLHVHSDYSLLDGCCRIDRLMDRATELGMSAVALTDHGNLYGAIEFYNQAKTKGIKPLIGCELYLVETSRLEKTGRSDEGKSIFHLGLLAKNLTGYQNLLKLVSDAHLKGFYYKPRTDFETLAQHAGGLIGFTGCLASLVPQHLLYDRYEEARKACGRFIEIFGRENYFVEIQDHGIPEQRKIIPGLLKLAEEFNLTVICTNDVHYVKNTDAGPHDAMLCIQTGAKIDEEKRMRFTGQEFYLKSRDEMAKLFAEIPESVTNTQLVAEMCDLSIPFPKGSERYPKYPLPPEIKTDRAGYLRDLCLAGLKTRYGFDYAAPEKFADAGLAKTLAERVDFELSIITKTGFIDYFLVVWDFIDWAKKQGIPVGPGRGSGAGCIVAYLLGITNLDPLRFKLLFERFLNPERVSPPDFDIDFCMRRRGEVIDYVRQKYGNACVANIITYGTLGAKMVIRDVSRVHNLAYGDADRLAKMIPDELNITLEDAVAKSTELRDEVTKNPVAKKIFDQARVLELPDEPRLTDLASAITDRLYAARANIRHMLRQPGYGQLLLTAGSLLQRAPFVEPPGAGDEMPSLLQFADRRLRRLLKKVLELADAACVDYPPSLHQLRIGIKRLRYAIEFFGPMIPGKSGAAAIKRLAGLQDELGKLNDLASAGTLLMVCAGRDPQLREAVTLIGGWHGRRHAALLDDVPNQLQRIRGVKLPRLDAAHPVPAPGKGSPDSA